MTIMLIAALVIIAAWAATRSLPAGFDGHKPLPYLIALIRWLWVPALLIAVVSGVSGHWPLTFLALALAADLGYLASPTYRNRQEHGSTNPGATYAARLKMASDGRKASTTLQKSPKAPTTFQKSTPTENPADTEMTFKETEPSHEGLNVMTLNCKYGHADAVAIVRAVAEQNIDILALQEMSITLSHRLEQAGLADHLPYRQLGEAKESDNGGFNGVYSRIEPIRQKASAVDLPAADVPSLTVNAKDGSTITLHSAHPKSPMRGCRQWSQGILALRALVNRQENSGTVETVESAGDPAMQPDVTTDPAEALVNQPSNAAPNDNNTSRPMTGTHGKDCTNRNDAMRIAAGETVIMGDFNSNVDHPSFRALLASGLTDTGLASPHRKVASFCTWLKWPRMELDHILTTSGLEAYDVHAISVPGTDHLGLTGRLTTNASARSR